MAEKLTPQQEMAVKNRGGKLLVSAAAGSGKTKVLVDRLMSYVMDTNDPADLDQFLIITFTQAAASELRGKIAAKLTEKMAENPENKHLQRQMQRLYLAKISTVHSFCSDLLREYAYLLDLPADFRVMDQNESDELREIVMERMLEAAYENAETDADFRSFVDAQGLGRDDRLVPEILLKVSKSAMCHLDPDGWLDRCVQNSDVDGLTDAGQTVWGRYLMDELFDCLDQQIEMMSRCLELANQAEAMEKPAAVLASDLQQLRHLRSSQNWDQVVARRNITYDRLTFSKKITDLELAEQIKTIRGACKTRLRGMVDSFTDDSAQALSDISQITASIRGLVGLVRRFHTEYAKLKRGRRVLDFTDLEHRTLDLVMGKHRTAPTAVALEIGNRFREIMVDEFQDTNEVQDALYSALSVKCQNCFMVGDVKQSIYQFRLADPSIFIDKYNSYVPAEEAQPGQGRKVVLSKNFRSGGDILKSVNDVFRLCMTPTVGGLYYGDEEALNEGIPHKPLGEPEVEFYAVNVQESKGTEEAAFVAKRIRELLDGNHFVRNGDSLRPIVPEDIAILMRAPGSGGVHYQRALESLGIRCIFGKGENPLKSQEIMLLRSILQTISNPRQDIPLLATLASPVFAFTADDLAAFRKGNRYMPIYDALLQSQEPKVQAFLETLDILRRQARMGTLAQLIEKIFSLTRMDSLYAAMENGEKKAENLQMFYAMAVTFESTARRDLEHFLEHLLRLDNAKVSTSAPQSTVGAVTIMSVHMSKGLEFPVVFVCDLSRSFNMENSRGQVLCDQELGLGLSMVDGKNRMKYPTIAKRAIALKTVYDNLSEEMRILYVALTRARDRLVMTFAHSNLQTQINNLSQRMDLAKIDYLSREATNLGQWVLMAALRRTEAGELFAVGSKPEVTAPGDPVWKISVVSAPQEELGSSAIEENTKPMPDGTVEMLKKSLAFTYAHKAATMAPSKQTATQRKGRDKDAEVAEDAPEAKTFHRSWRKPGEAKQVKGTDMGNAVHAVMEHIPFEACGDENGVAQEIRRMAVQGLISQEQAAMVDQKKIAAFFATDLGKKLRAGSNVLREFKFSILDDATQYGDGLDGEKILLQGVVDCAMVEEDGITIVDFKTDFVTEETLVGRAELYKPQVLAYANAMERIFEKKVKSAVLYFFRLGKYVSVTEN